MSRLTLLFRINKRDYILTILLLIAGYALIAFQMYNMNQTATANFINDSYGYYQGPVNIEGVDNKNVEIINVPAFNSDLSKFKYGDSYNNLATDLTTLDYGVMPSEIYRQNLGEIENGDYVETYSVQLSPYGSEIKNFNIPIESLEASQIYAGSYPSTEDQIAIPFNLALKIADKNNLKQYQDVINTTLEFSFLGQNVSKEIVGIVDGNNVIMPSNAITKDVTKDADIIKFDSYKDIKAIEKAQNINILTEQDIQSNATYYVYGLEIILIWLVCIGMLKENYMQAVNYLQQIKYQRRNYLTVSLGIITPLLILTVILYSYL